ncbi:unnamed protein product [marine sediment metagenome]|uniref:Uncharacterized protein n=1 Tax=marine sediment metagenome TaxID=412755 RepID=X1EEZ5_9ZZZZ
MSKILRVVINGFIRVCTAFVGALISGNILVAGFIFFPDIVTKVDVILGPNPSGFAYVLIPGTLPVFYVVAFLSFAVFIMFSTVRFVKDFDIQKIF